jgi:hypothetical protein
VSKTGRFEMFRLQTGRLLQQGPPEEALEDAQGAMSPVRSRDHEGGRKVFGGDARFESWGFDPV